MDTDLEKIDDNGCVLIRCKVRYVDKKNVKLYVIDTKQKIKISKDEFDNIAVKDNEAYKCDNSKSRQNRPLPKRPSSPPPSGEYANSNNNSNEYIAVGGRKTHRRNKNKKRKTRRRFNR